MEDSMIAKKSKAFAVRIVRAARYLKKEKQEYELANQLLRSGTSIGANVAEAKYAQSDKDFVSKLKIALKEANETEYWLEVIVLSGTLSNKEVQSLADDVKELLRMLISIIKTKQENMDNQ